MQIPQEWSQAAVMAVVVGSAIVSIIAEHGEDVPAAMTKVKSLLRDIKDALDNSESIQNIA